jgi:glycogen debranching enzyme
VLSGPAAMAARAAYILRDNSSGSVTKAAPELYPHQWSWDSAFNAIGLAAVDVPRATAELDALFSAQWANGMVPHIVFDPAATLRYFPGPDWWDSQRSPDAPRHLATTGLCQPPVHAIAAARILEVAGRNEADAAHAEAWIRAIYPKLVAWHRFIAKDRIHPGTGLATIYHGWESGLDNSPRWDPAYACVAVDPNLPPYQRHDLAHVASPAERPTAEEYDRYLTLVEEMKAVDYDPDRMREVCSFQVGDVLFTALFADANGVLAGLAERVGAAEGPDLVALAESAREAVLAQIDPTTGLAGDVDLRTGEPIRTETIAGFAPLLAGSPPPQIKDRLVDLLAGPRWMGYPGLRWPLPPSTSPCSDAFRARSYWRGPVWPVMDWLLDRSLTAVGALSLAASIRSASLEQLTDATFAEYYEPLTGEPLGSHRQSWTAAVALDWLVGRDAF